MNINIFRQYCLAKKGVSESFPFDDVTLVYKILTKMFALADVDNFLSINLKCDPEKAVELRECFDAVKPGYHMNKKHWITVAMDGSIEDKLIKMWIDESYLLVMAKLNRSEKDFLASL